MTDRVEWDGARTDALLAGADCGVMPIPDTPFTRGKCGYKLLQYGAAGFPAVGSPVGVNAGLIDELDGLQPPTPTPGGRPPRRAAGVGAPSPGPR